MATDFGLTVFSDKFFIFPNSYKANLPCAGFDEHECASLHARYCNVLFVGILLGIRSSLASIILLFIQLLWYILKQLLTPVSVKLMDVYGWKADVLTSSTSGSFLASHFSLHILYKMVHLVLRIKDSIG